MPVSTRLTCCFFPAMVEFNGAQPNSEIKSHTTSKQIGWCDGMPTRAKKLIRAIFLGKQFIGYHLLAGKGDKISIYQQWAEIFISQQCENILTLELFPAFLLIRWNCQMLSLFYFILFYNRRGETFFRTMVSWTDFKRTVARIADERWPRGRVRWKHKPINEKSHDACWLVLTVFYTNVRL